MASDPSVVWPVEALLGEGPVWIERDAALWFTDIKSQRIHRYDPASGERRSWNSPEQVGFVLPAANGGLIAGLQSGLHRFDPESGRFDLIATVEPDLPDNRLNDGVVDPTGRLWFGTMDNNERSKSGAFYSYRAGVLTPSAVKGIAITNGPAISPDGRTLYWVDTVVGTMSACEIHDDGELGESRIVVAIPGEEGHPDGPTTDSEGCIWISLYAGWEARRYAPTGELLDRVRFPVANITKIALGGDDLRTAYATTARQKLSPEQIAPQPDIGNLFTFRVDVPGLPTPLVAD